MADDRLDYSADTFNLNGGICSPTLTPAGGCLGNGTATCYIDYTQFQVDLSW